MSLTPRQFLKSAKRIVVKFGSRVLLDDSGKPDLARMRDLVRQIAEIRREHGEVVVVSSGAIGTGMEVLGLKKRPKNLPDLQMAAAVGQSRLMANYTQFFAEHDSIVGQVLLTHEDLKNRVRHLNARNAILRLLEYGVVPIINENDAIAVDEIKVGDNDVLASLVAMLVDAPVLVLCTTTDGLHEPDGMGQTRRVPYVPTVTDEVLGLAKGKGGEISTGGMATKLMAAHNIAKLGGLALIIDGRKPNEIRHALAGEDCGTIIGLAPVTKAPLSRRKQWIAFFHRVSGSLIVDDGAREALQSNGKSLLAAGIKKVEGRFGIGSLVKVETQKGDMIGRGLVEFSSDDIQRIKGNSTSQIEAILGSIVSDEVIHRDNFYVER